MHNSKILCSSIYSVRKILFVLCNQKYYGVFVLLERTTDFQEWNTICWMLKFIWTYLNVNVQLRGNGVLLLSLVTVDTCPCNKVRGANMGPIWDRQDPGGPHVGLMNSAYLCSELSCGSLDPTWKVNHQSCICILVCVINAGIELYVMLAVCYLDMYGRPSHVFVSGPCVTQIFTSGILAVRRIFNYRVNF